VLEGCSARRDERRVASHTSEEQRRNAPASAVENGTFAFSASLSRRLLGVALKMPCRFGTAGVVAPGRI
jgi:hypothetical protein